MSLTSLITEMFIFMNLVLVLLMHDVFGHLVEERLSQVETNHMKEIDHINHEMAQLEKRVAYLQSNCILKPDTAHQVTFQSSVFRWFSSVSLSDIFISLI